MAEFNRYWAEEALGEPYAPEDYRWMKSTRRAGMILGGVTCVLTTGALLGAAVYHLVDPAPRVSVSSYEFDPASAQLDIAVVLSENKSPDRAQASRPVDVASTARPKTDSGGNTPAAPAKPTARPEQQAVGQAGAPRHTATPAAAAAQGKVQVATAAPAPAPAPIGADRGTPAQDRRQLAKSPEVTAKPEADIRIGLSKAAESKPADIASGEKLGIREILPDGIVMQNGRKVKNGSALPNGEVLMGTDASKGMVETDRRVLVLTP